LHCVEYFQARLLLLLIASLYQVGLASSNDRQALKAYFEGMLGTNPADCLQALYPRFSDDEIQVSYAATE
jgi:hypothetical protein